MNSIKKFLFLFLAFVSANSMAMEQQAQIRELKNSTQLVLLLEGAVGLTFELRLEELIDLENLPTLHAAADTGDVESIRLRLRSGEDIDDKGLEKLLVDAVMSKPSGHQLGQGETPLKSRTMKDIGG